MHSHIVAIGKLALLAMALVLLGSRDAVGERQLERLGRGVVAVCREDGTRLVSWRLLGTDPKGIAFNVYRATGDGEPARLNNAPLTEGTNYVDATAASAADHTYVAKAVVDGVETEASAPFRLADSSSAQPFLSVPLQTPDGYAPNDASVGDLDGDGEYELVVHQVGSGRDNSQRGTTSEPIFEAYTLGGEMLWRINLGRNIREGAHYTQFIVYDLDGDGRAEFACKTADGTVDGVGQVMGDADADYRNADGYVLDGPEYLTIFDGKTGAALATEAYIPPRGKVADWGDDYGNRVDRFLACVAYLDGERPSLVMCRGYYTRTVLAAWNWRQGALANVWTFDSDNYPGYAGQGNHNLSVADVDGDGKDEIVFGACAVDGDGTGLYTTGLGHGDAMHLTDINPARAGLEVWGIHERPQHLHGANLRDARTGEVLWGLDLDDPGRGLALDIDPRYAGSECWTNDSDGLYSCTGEKISDAKPRSCNMGVWWDGDLLRELLDGSGSRGGRSGRSSGSAFIDKWDYGSGTTTRLLDGTRYDCVAINGTKGNPCLCADILGDWREEVVWATRDGRELRIFTTPIPTEHRLVTLMHDPVYRLGIAWQNVAYNQPAHVGFYVGGAAP